MVRRPASKRLLKVGYTLKPKIAADDGTGGRTFNFDAGGSVVLDGTELAVITEEFADELGNQVADRGVYVTWVDPTNGTPKFEDRLFNPLDGFDYEIKRTARQSGLVRCFCVQVVESR